MDIFEAIKDDHKEVRRILDELVSSSKLPKDQKLKSFGQLRAGLLPHMYAEEDLFYPFARNEAGLKDLILEAEEEHTAARNLLAELESMDVGHERWIPKLQVLQDLLLHHIETEEGEIFNGVRGCMDTQQAQTMAKDFLAIEELPGVGVRA